MSQYLRLVHNLLVTLGGTPSPEVFPIREFDDSATSSSSQTAIKKGDKLDEKYDAEKIEPKKAEVNVSWKQFKKMNK